MVLRQSAARSDKTRVVALQRPFVHAPVHREHDAGEIRRGGRAEERSDQNLGACFEWETPTVMKRLLCFAEFFNLLNESRKIGLSETHVWRGDTTMLDVGRDVFIVTQQLQRVGSHQ